MDIESICRRRAERLDELLKESSNWNQARLAAVLGVQPAYISHLCTHRRRMTDRTARAIEVALGLPTHRLDSNGGIGDVPSEPEAIFGIDRETVILAFQALYRERDFAYNVADRISSEQGNAAPRREDFGIDEARRWLRVLGSAPR